MLSKRTLPTILVLACCLLLPPASASGLGGIDESFGEGGVADATPHIGAYPYQSPIAMSVAPGGRIYLLDEAGFRCERVCSSDLYLTRLRPDGSRDWSYRGEGAALVLRGRTPGGVLAVDSRGRPVVATAGPSGITVLRFKRDGRRDGRFGAGGRAFVPCVCSARRVMFDARGRIVVEGERLDYVPTYPESDSSFRRTFVIARLLPDGRLDPVFAAGGVGSWMVPAVSEASGLTVRPGGSIFAAGPTCCIWPPSQYVMGVTRGGELDSRFGETASAALSGLGLPGGIRLATPWAALPRSHGRVDLLGSAEPFAGYMVRFLPNGSLDRGFSGDGLRLFGWSVYGAAMDRHGNVFTIGTERGRWNGLVAYWLRPSGRVIRSFGGGLGAFLDGWDPLGATVAIQRGRWPIVFEEGNEGCRSYCPPHPRLVRFNPAPVKRHRAHR